MDDTAESISERLTEALNRHGYVFQHRVLKEAEDIFAEKLSRSWMFEAAELPVEVNGYGTRIDFVLKARRSSMHLVCECKRANPRISNWCFVKAPYIGRDANKDWLVAEFARMENSNYYSTGALIRPVPETAYHLAFQVKSGQKGDSKGGGEDAIEAAVSQVCRGVNGLVELFANRSSLFAKKNAAVFVPVIFTTARLWTTDVELRGGDIRSGELAQGEAKVEERDWVYYQYHQSTGLMHSQRRRTAHSSLSSWMQADSIRTVLVVNAAASRSFLSRFGDDMHGIEPL